MSADAEVLSYAMDSGHTRKVARRLYRASLICGALPLSLGVLIFLMWLGSRDYGLETAGLFLIPAGCLCVLVGSGCLVAYLVVCWRGRTDKVGRIAWRTLLAFLLLGVNFPAAAVVAETALYVMSRSVVVIENHTAGAVEGIEVVDILGTRVYFGDLPAGQSMCEGFCVYGEGSLNLEFRQGGAPMETRLGDYATRGIRKHVTFAPDGTVEVTDLGP